MPRINASAAAIAPAAIESPVVNAVSNSTESVTAIDCFEGSTAISAKAPQTALQKHVGFFDMDSDGSVSTSEIIEGIQQLGGTGVKVYILAPVVSFVIGTMTRGYPSFSTDLSNIKAGKHEGSSNVFDEDGNFDSGKFEELFEKFDTNKDGMLDGVELENFSTRNAKTFFGRIVVKANWNLLLKIAGEDREVNGETTRVLTKERLGEFYDGSLFYKLAGREVPVE